MSGIILALGLILCCIYINRFIVSRVVHLSKNVGVYKRMKDGGVASDLMASNRGNDEISELYTQTASMIEEINEYVENLKNTTKQLSEAREQATHDALTGIRNKNAYDIEIMSIEADIQKGSYYYGIVMVDMNYLKNLNDNYGHDIGNLAIRKLCRLICLTFEHSPVFRVGGDEFVVLLKGYDYQHIVQLADKFNQNIETIASDDDLKDWKPIIYLYPEETSEVSVKLWKSENLLHTYPKYVDWWKVIASPDWTLIDTTNNRSLYALYWEWINEEPSEINEWFAVKWEDTISFLEEKLATLWLNEREAEEFIVYWLPILENNKWNLIRFRTLEETNKIMPLDITPTPDTVIRVLMQYKPLDEYQEVSEQELTTPERNWFTVVEWWGEANNIVK